ncbi:hypothetical protein PI172_1512 [Prevotella intermedia]|uniref:Uncharacterized protein n=1 Tax=Prevotella intermedia TaxID=28131 RepID=A0AAD1BKW9_PREIN|nr:hypothetical protein PI172_1512 [Prevotella intermedia]
MELVKDYRKQYRFYLFADREIKYVAQAKDFNKNSSAYA